METLSLGARQVLTVHVSDWPRHELAGLSYALRSPNWTRALHLLDLRNGLILSRSRSARNQH